MHLLPIDAIDLHICVLSYHVCTLSPHPNTPVALQFTLNDSYQNPKLIGFQVSAKRNK